MKRHTKNAAQLRLRIVLLYHNMLRDSFLPTMASMLIYNKVDVVSVSKRLGHSKTSTTVDIYSHVIKEADRQNSEILESVFLKNA